MKIGILTSTRADFGIYIPLLKALFSDHYFKPEIIAFGTHLSKKHGETINEILKQGFTVAHQINTKPEGDDMPVDISKSIGETIVSFSSFWETHEFDLVFALGDRYEMFAAVTAASPFNITFAHLHAGETTLGAIDNTYRHSISLMSKYLLVSTEEYKKRAIEITQNSENTFNVGALSIDNLVKADFFSKKEFLEEFGIDLTIPTVLSTFHPETVALDKNKIYIQELLEAFDEIKVNHQIVITMPNADTMGRMIRNEIEKFAKDKAEIILIESFGMKGYLTCMKHCKMLIGNTSSGFAEAAFFPNWVINIGDRQKGRIITPNICTVPAEKSKILNAVKSIENSQIPLNINIYGQGQTAEKIKKILKAI